MLRLRPYKKSDAPHIMSWVPDQAAYSAWCANHLEWPLDQGVFDRYQARIEEEPNSWIMTAVDDAGIPVGCLTMKRADYEKSSIHLAAIIVDSSRRGQGLGTEMMKLTLRYAREILGLSRVTLNVFEHNLAARGCYAKAGFREIDYSPNCFPNGDQLWSRYIMAAE